MASTKQLRNRKVGLLCALFLIGLCVVGRGQTTEGVGTITTYVGPPDAMEGAAATSQFLDLPVAVRPDNAGGFYVASGDRIYRVTSDGALHYTAGNGSAGFSGDGGAARLAQLNQPRGIAVDGVGNLFISDSGNHRIRKVTPAGIITTVAGNGSDSFGGDGGPAISAPLATTGAIAMDGAGNLFIAGNNRIRKMNPSGIISTIAGNGSLGSSGDGGPALAAQVVTSGVAVDRMGNLFIADGNSRIRRVTPDGMITTVAGNGKFGFSGDGGPATSAQLNQPFAIAVDGNGSLFIADFANHRVRKVTAAGIITTVAGTGQVGFSGDGSDADGAQLRSPFDIAITSAGGLLIASNGRIRMVTPAGMITSVAGTSVGDFGGDGGPAVSPQTELVFPTSATLDKAGNLFITDATRVRRVSPDGTITTVAGNGDSSSIAVLSSQLGFPRGIVVDPDSNLLMADGLNHRILKVSPNGMITTIAGNGTPGFSGDNGPAISAQLTLPSALAVDAAGNIFIADNGNHRIRKISVSGVISTVAGTGVSGFGGDGGPATSALIRSPNGLAIDLAGDLFIADTLDNRVRKVNVSGTITTVAGNGTRGFDGDGSTATSAQLNAPVGITMDATGNLVVADSGNHRIRKIIPAGIITTIAGNGSLGFSGDGGSAISAQLSQPSYVAMDSKGNLFVIDSSKRIRKVTFSGNPENR